MSTRIKLNRQGVAALLKDPKIAADLERRAEAIAAAAGDGMEASVQTGQTRARASVVTGSLDARLAEARDRSLTSALGAGRT